MKNILLVVSLVTAAVAGASHAAGDPAAGKAKSVTCAACHGADGNSVNPEWPKLAGQHESYLFNQLRYFKSGERVNVLMAGQVAALSEQDMADLAAYYAGLDVSIGEADPTKVRLGAEVYRAGNAESGVSACIACHGPTGAGNPLANYPRLNGQHATYTVNQLNAYRSGERANEGSQIMRGIAARMTDAEIEAVAQYIQGLHGS